MESAAPHFFDPYAEVTQSLNRLPHWQQTGAAYFVTFRLADYVPSRLLRECEEARENWKKYHPPPWTSEVELEYHTEISAKFDRHLDAGHGSCILRGLDIAEIVSGRSTILTATAIRTSRGS